MKDGLIEEFWENGQLSFKRNFKNGEPDGIWASYYDSLIFR
tara:strand:+ start:1533 stop:1655 length:123 start_codon:yes stop_codon:yes gene_type:complete